MTTPIDIAPPAAGATVRVDASAPKVLPGGDARNGYRSAHFPESLNNYAGLRRPTPDAFEVRMASAVARAAAAMARHEQTAPPRVEQHGHVVVVGRRVLDLRDPTRGIE